MVKGKNNRRKDPTPLFQLKYFQNYFSQLKAIKFYVDNTSPYKIYSFYKEVKIFIKII